MAKRPGAEVSRPNANPDDTAAYFRELMDFETRMARIKQAMGAAQTRYEAMGVDVKGVKLALRMSKMDDAQEQFRRNTRTLVQLGIITVEADGQGSFIEGLKVAMPGTAAAAGIKVARAYNDGYNSGRHGAAIDTCSFAPGSEEYVKWRDGWDDGHRDLLLRKPDADKVVQASGRGRGRPPGSPNKPKLLTPPVVPVGPSTLSEGPAKRGGGRRKGVAAANDDIGDTAGNA